MPPSTAVASEAKPAGLFHRGLRRAVHGVVGVLFAAALSASAAMAASDDFNIGFIGTLSGAGADRAQDQLDGFQLAVKHLGGRLGGMEFNLSAFDDKRSPETARQLAVRLTQTEHVHVLLLSSDEVVSAAAIPVALAAKTFVISLDAPAARFAGKECSPYLFSVAGLAETMHEVAGQYLQAQGYGTVVVVRPGGAEDAQALDAFRRGFKGNLAEIVSRRGEMNFDDTLDRIRRESPDAVYVLDSGGMAVNFLIQFAASGLKNEFRLFAPGSGFDQTVLSAAGPASVDALSVAPWSPDLDAPSNHRLVADFETDYGRLPSLYAAEGYDAAMLLDSALKAVDKKFTQGDLFRAALRRADFASTRGSFRFDTNQFPIQSYLVRQVTTDGRDQLVDEQRGVLVRDLRDGHAAECPMRWVPEPPPKG